MQDVQLSEEFPLIVANRERLGGKPCIKGTRISVMHVLEVLASGGDIEDFKRGYPEVPEEGVRQAILYAADRMRVAAVEAAPAR